MPVCPVCFASTSQDAKICSECGVDLSLPPDEVRSSLDSTTSPFSTNISSGITTDSKPVRCKACGSENFTSARFCEKCNQSLYQTITPPKKRRKLVLLIVIAVLAQIVFFTVVYKGISYVWEQVIHKASYFYETEASLPEAEYMEVSYDDYAVKPDGVMGDNIKVTGTVSQIERELEKDNQFLSLYICEDFEGEKIWMVGYHLKDNENIEEGDVLTFYGQSHGLVKREAVDTGKTVYLPVIRATVFKDDDAISGKTWSEEDIAIFDLHEDGTCTVTFGKGEEGEFTDTGTYKVYQGRSALTYVATDLEELGLTQSEQISEFELRDYLDDYYCLVLYRDEDVQEGDNSVPVPTLFYIGIYSEETGELFMLNSTTLSFVTLTEVTE
jgi:hypothetical protein